VLTNTVDNILSRFIKIKVPMNPALTWKPLRRAENKAGSTIARTLEAQLMWLCHRWSHLGRMFQTLKTSAIALGLLEPYFLGRHRWPTRRAWSLSRHYRSTRLSRIRQHWSLETGDPTPAPDCPWRWWTAHIAGFSNHASWQCSYTAGWLRLLSYMSWQEQTI